MDLPTNRRSVRRCAFVASAEVTELSSGARLSARTSEQALGGCYIDALHPFPQRALDPRRRVRDQVVFATHAKLIYCDRRLRLFLAFAGTTTDQRSLLEAWLPALVVQLKLVSCAPSAFSRYARDSYV